MIRALLLSCLSWPHHSADEVVLGTGQAVVVRLRVALGRRGVHGMSHRPGVATDEPSSTLLVIELVRSLHYDILLGTRYARLVRR